jgi:hypothetical protein
VTVSGRRSELLSSKEIEVLSNGLLLHMKGHEHATVTSAFAPKCSREVVFSTKVHPESMRPMVRLALDPSPSP